ncbi:MAG: AMP-binding protein [Chloroflexi bacterium]|nr:AMP-binding protein [Chloroflexota bacterium]
MSAWTDPWTGKTIGSALAEATQRYGSREAMIFANGIVTYQQLLDTSDLLARAFLSKGVRKGDKVAIWMAGYTEWPFLYYALARIGAVMVPINTRYKTVEFEYVLNKSRAGILVFKDEEARGKDHLGTLKELYPELERAVPGGLSSERLPLLREVIVISDKQFPGCSSFEDLLAAGSTVPEEALFEAEARVTADDLALLQFTSGTTALPKGAMLFQSAMLRGAYYVTKRLGISEQDRFFSPQPFFHVGGAIEVMLAPVVIGCTMIVQTYFDASEALRMMEENRCTVTMGHQPHFIEYLNHPDLKKRQLRLERGHIFATPDVSKRVYEEMGIRVLISPYGMTESHLGGTSCTADDPLEKRLNTVGRVMPGMEVGIREPGGSRLLPVGATGEVCFRGWCVMKGYYDDPQRTAEVLDDEGWLRTGDLGILDEEGYLRLVGRFKDMIRVGGENVAAPEVEAFLLQHDKVKQAALVGAPDQRLGEVCVAFIELKPGVEATEEEIVNYCRGKLASFKIPRKVVFVREWPMSGTGKIQKFLLKEKAAQEYPANQ